MKKEFFECEYCGAVLKTRRGYDNHSCTKKRLAKETSDASMVRAKWLFDFWINYNGYGNPRTQAKFERSPHYRPFVEFTHHAEQIYLPAPAVEFIKWASDEKIPLVQWKTDKVTNRFKKAFERGDHVLEAVASSLEQIASWCDGYGVDMSEFFGMISPAEMIRWLQSGRMSPWVFMLSPKNAAFISRCDNDQIDFISDLLDVDYWDSRLSFSTGPAAEVLTVLKEVGLA